MLVPNEPIFEISNAGMFWENRPYFNSTRIGSPAA